MRLTGKHILFQGDSITDGNRYRDEAQRWDKNHQIGHSYVYLLSALLGRRYAAERMIFTNRGVSGDTVQALAARWETDALALRPDVLSVLIGTNDAARTGGADEVFCTAFEECYASLLARSKAQNPALEIVLLEPFYFPLAEPDRLRRAAVDRLRASVRSVAERADAVFVPLQETFDRLCAVREPSYWLWDGVHPTESGHAVIAEAWLRAVLGEEPLF